jgi:hypothetical protein
MDKLNFFIRPATMKGMDIYIVALDSPDGHPPETGGNINLDF